MLGYHPQVIMAGRRINDGMGKFVAEQTIKQMIASGRSIKGAKVIILGLTFKENCADLRNSKVIDIIHELQSYDIQVFVTDPLADEGEAMNEYLVNLHTFDDLPLADAMIAAVSHDEFHSIPICHLLSKLVKGGNFIDVKAKFNKMAIEANGATVWRL